MKRVRLSGSASAYLRREATYLRRHLPSAADAFLSRMRDARERLGQYPASGPRHESGGSSLRTLVVDDDVFVYRIVEDEVRILLIRHGRQDRRSSPDAE